MVKVKKHWREIPDTRQDLSKISGPGKYKVTGISINRITRKAVMSKPRNEIINTRTNSLFKNAHSPSLVERTYEAFWNDLNPASEHIVKVISVVKLKEPFDEEAALNKLESRLNKKHGIHILSSSHKKVGKNYLIKYKATGGMTGQAIVKPSGTVSLGS